MIAVSSLEFDPRLSAVTPIPELIEYLLGKNEGEKKELQKKRAETLSADWDAFVASIEQNGIRDPLKIKSYKGEFLVIDGRHRLLAAKQLGFAQVPCIFPEVDYTRDNADEDDRAVMLEAENRRHLSKGALAYRAVVLYPEVATEVKKGKQMDNEYPFKSQSELANRVGVSHPLMKSACSLYRVFNEHKELRQRFQNSVWMCENISKLLGDMNARVALFEQSKTYDYPQPKKLTAEEKAEQDLKAKRVEVLVKLSDIRIFGQGLSENWDVVEEEDLEEITPTFEAFLSDLPPALHSVAENFYRKGGSDE